MLFAEFLDGEGAVDFIERDQFVFVIGDAGLFGGDHHALGEWVVGDVWIGVMGAECQLNRFHEAHIDEVFQLDLAHEVLDHGLVLVANHRELMHNYCDKINY